MKSVAFALLLTIWPIPQASRDAKIVNAGGFDVIGIAVRTSNRAEMGTQGEIPKLWQRFYSEHLADQIPMRADQNLVALYYDYESDKDGKYTYMIGAPVKHLESPVAVPTGMTLKRVPPGKYAVFTSEQGPLASVVIGTWKKIWGLEKGKPGSDRAYTVDYDYYDGRSQFQGAAEMDVYVSIKERNHP